MSYYVSKRMDTPAFKYHARLAHSYACLSKKLKDYNAHHRVTYAGNAHHYIVRKLTNTLTRWISYRGAKP